MKVLFVMSEEKKEGIKKPGIARRLVGVSGYKPFAKGVIDDAFSTLRESFEVIGSPEKKKDFIRLTDAMRAGGFESIGQFKKAYFSKQLLGIGLLIGSFYSIYMTLLAPNILSGVIDLMAFVLISGFYAQTGYQLWLVRRLASAGRVEDARFLTWIDGVMSNPIEFFPLSLPAIKRVKRRAERASKVG